MQPSRGQVVFTVTVFVILASLDNMALGLLPGMTIPVAADLGVPEGRIGLITALVIFLTAVTAVYWGYLGDQRSRKRLLFWGTLIWAAGTAASATSQTFTALLLWQMLTSVGLGSIASVGFSVVSDLISPRRRGIAMSFWGLSQGAGFVAGGLLASQLGASDWRTPLWVTALAGGAFAALYLFTFDPPRGRSEPQLAELFDQGDFYEHRIEANQLRDLARVKSNWWIVLEGIGAQIGYGSLLWAPLLYQTKVIAEGYSPEMATRVGGMLVTVFQLSVISAVAAGWLGDRWQARNPRGRALLSMVGIVGAVPFFVAFFFIPLRGLDVTPGAGFWTLLGEVLREMVTNPWVAAALLTSFLALVLTAVDSPNWFALISDVNLPEHRGTVYGAGNFANGIGRSIGNWAGGLGGDALAASFPPPLNWAIVLTIGQVGFLPAGWCYWKLSKTAPADIAAVAAELDRRALKPETGSS